MKSNYFIALYVAALVLLAFLFYLSISSTAAETNSEGISMSLGGYSISAWGIVCGVLWVGLFLLYFQVRKKFRNRFPRSKRWK